MSQEIKDRSSQRAVWNSVTFINSQVGLISTREKEILRSQALSHAAIVSHRRQHSQKAGRRPLSTARCKQRVRLSQPESFKKSPCLKSDLTVLDCEQRVNIMLVKTSNDMCSVWPTKEESYIHQQHFCATTMINSMQDKPNTEPKIIELAIPSPRPGVGCFRGELFAGILNELSIDVRELIDLNFQITNPVNELATEVFNVTNVFPLYLSFLHYRVYYYAGLVLVGAVLELIRTGTTYQHSPKLLRLRGLAMENIRMHTSRPGWQHKNQNQGLVTAILSLVLLEYTSGHPESALQHFSGLRTIVATLGGLESLPGIGLCPERTFVTFFRDFFAMRFGVPMLTHEDKPEQTCCLPEPAQRPNHTSDRKLSPGFTDLMLEGRLCSNTIQILQRAADVEIGRNDRVMLQIRADRGRELRMYDGFIQACPIFCSSDEDQSILMDKMICFALLLFCSNGSHPTDVIRAFAA